VEAEKIFETLKNRLPEAVREFHAQTRDPYIVIEPAQVRPVLMLLRDDPALRFEMLLLVSGVDWRDRFEVVYHLTSLTYGHRIALKATLPHDDPHIGSAAAIYPTANWHERETYDLMGIVFDGHPDLRRIFLPDDWEGHPLRKDYVSPESYHGISNKR
jgi:NADH-quinone oxidoreductase subunit C